MKHVKCVIVDANGVRTVTDLGDGPFDISIVGEFVDTKFEDVVSMTLDCESP